MAAFCREGSGGRVSQRRRTRQRLLAAATEQIRGGALVTVDEAARGAGVSRATGYRYFPTGELLRQEAALTEVLQSVDGPVAEVRELCERIPDHAERVEAVVRCMGGWAWGSQAALRMTLRATLSGTYRRPNYRQEWIALALAPATADLPPEAAEQLRRALYPLFGLDSLLALSDLLHLTREQALDTLAFTARAVVTAALRQRRPQPTSTAEIAAP